MTNVYGVTFIGAKEQIQSRLKEITALQDVDTSRLSQYLTSKVFSSLGEMFKGARDIQLWLNEAAGRIAKTVCQKIDERPVNAEVVSEDTFEQKAGNSVRSLLKDVKSEGLDVAEIEADDLSAMKMPTAVSKTLTVESHLKDAQNYVVWTTPLGLTIVQPYRKGTGRQVKTDVQFVSVVDPSSDMKVDTRKQKTAFPPNFIHSLDASHMLLSAVECNAAGLTFAAVHDSYWTHAADVEKMAKILREQFIVLHKQPLMDNLASEFQERYKDFLIPADVLQKYEDRQLLLLQSLDDQKITSNIESKEGDVEHSLNMPDSDDIAESIHEDDITDMEEVMSNLDDEEHLPMTSKSRGSHRLVPFTLPPLPERGDFDVSEVAESPYFFH